jgi:protein yorkie
MAFNNTSGGAQSQQTSQLQQGADDDALQQQKKNNLIILVDKDSNDKLDELFEKTLNNTTSLHKPYKMRKLPASFFKPPQSGSKSPSVSHSRENSADSAFGSGTTILNSVGNQNNNSNNSSAPPHPAIAPAASAVINGLAIHHSRAHSSPASLGKLPLNINLNLSALNLGSVTPTNSPSPNHSTTNINSSSNMTNNSNKSTLGNTSSGGILGNSAAAANNQSNTNNNLPHNISLEKTLQHIHSRGRSYDIPSLQHQLQFSELPPGWEQAKTHDGKIYYIK